MSNFIKRRRLARQGARDAWLLGLAASAAFLAAGSLMGARAGEENAEEAPEAREGTDLRLGAEVDRICFGRNINGWKPVKGEDDVVLLERGVDDWYRVELTGACEERLFRFAQAIGIESRPSGGCVTHGDVIIVEDTGNFARRCFIRRIYEWNDKAPAPEEASPGEDA
ncbi:DUF6491 family protein [Amphiplicatus metriothermophilus]|uniref:Uncharacterized protein n=1 Tax=Amphiplicatus metriothermophilus TaxID=1519374 RepID=A0A239PJX5_9PROT|nr:DUF6491 family protein [Amphiplicatus metriothermophilus]MBB5518033.1 hypothetical protein [Amphiplicatus metriothermophilus]SNT67633.1 hypothetical protein SAMN06297382_0125 [Amphiplicatus metriothermophilus]